MMGTMLVFHRSVFRDVHDRSRRDRRYRGAVHIGPAPQGAPRTFIIVWGSEGRVKRMNRAYELMIIIDGDVEDPKAQAWMKTVTEAVTTAGGQLHGKIDWWGKRQFAYPINKKPSGYYMVAEILAPGASLDELERTLRLADDVVRHKLIRLPDAEAARRGMAVTAA